MKAGMSDTLHRLSRWLKFKRVCAWCKPHRRIGGNPLASQVTHAICPQCLAAEMADIRKGVVREV